MFQDKLRVWAGRRLAQIGTLTVGVVGNWFLNYGFDFLIYPYVLYTFGTLEGWIIMVLLSLVVSLLTLWFYDWAKKDWVGIEAIKSLRDGESINKVGRFTAWALKKGDPVVLVVLSIQFDPVITALYLRRGANQFNGFSRRDWRNFLISVIIANLYWGSVVLFGMNVFQLVWGWIQIF